MTSLTVFVMLDACRPDYIKKKATPFLHKLASKGFSSPVEPTFGFEPDAAYLAGLYPDQADGGAQFCYAPNHIPGSSPFGFAKALPRILNRMPELPQKILRKLLVIIARQRSDSPNLSTARIPFHLLHLFTPAMSHNLDHPQFLNTSTIFDLLRTTSKPYLFHAAPEFRVTMDAALKRAKKELQPPLSFAFFHIGNLDGVGHRYGPDSKEIQLELSCVDNGLEQLYKLAKKRFASINFIIMGDHGMIKVDQLLNIQKHLEKQSITNNELCSYLLDSTMARFWFKTKKAKTRIRSVLADLPNGRILTQKDRDRYHLNWPHNRFGDLIYIANPGTLIFPNHFQQHAPVKGMHGYAPEFYGQQAALLINGPGISTQHQSKPADMRQIFPTLCWLLKIDRPALCRLESLVTP